MVMVMLTLKVFKNRRIQEHHSKVDPKWWRWIQNLSHNPVAGQTNVVADPTTDTLTFVAGSQHDYPLQMQVLIRLHLHLTGGGGGGGSPGGTDTQVQFNDGSVFGGDRFNFPTN